MDFDSFVIQRRLVYLPIRTFGSLLTLRIVLFSKVSDQEKQLCSTNRTTSSSNHGKGLISDSPIFKPSVREDEHSFIRLYRMEQHCTDISHSKGGRTQLHKVVQNGTTLYQYKPQ
ncbi:hypothetical protein H5410_054762 [Solanum commersonii]|uniref:Uncharacterized protein n=1 Tax=Solanum commersonii TaxID=4109 RepID=A0A9J5WHC2_SOLCO|nr:hypothetical protein H5410_054762 [Solanum commersonii]